MRIFSPESRVGPVQVTPVQEQAIKERLATELAEIQTPAPLSVTTGKGDKGMRQLSVELIVADTTSGVKYAEIGKPLLMPPDIRQRIEKIFSEVGAQ